MAVHVVNFLLEFINLETLWLRKHYYFFTEIYIIIDILVTYLSVSFMIVAEKEVIVTSLLGKTVNKQKVKLLRNSVIKQMNEKKRKSF